MRNAQENCRWAAATVAAISMTLAAISAPAQTFTALYAFNGTTGGKNPNSTLLADPAGNLYGTAEGGGIQSGICAPQAGCGLVFKMEPNRIEIVLHTFTGGTDGGVPLGGLLRDGVGNLIGTTYFAGKVDGVCAPYGCGVVFKIDTSGNESVLHTFSGREGMNPNGGLIQDAAGNLYGATALGGNSTGCLNFGCGVLFELGPNRKETVLYNFTGGADGSSPTGGLVRDSVGNLYGLTATGGNGGSCQGQGCGILFKLDTAGQLRVLHSFTGGLDGGLPTGGLVSDSEGNLYGTALEGGSGSNGLIFEFDPTGNETVLYAFGGTDGSEPIDGVFRDAAGDITGTTTYGGTRGYGVVYWLSPTKGLTVLHSFDGTADGAYPPRAFWNATAAFTEPRESAAKMVSMAMAWCLS